MKDVWAYLRGMIASRFLYEQRVPYIDASRARVTAERQQPALLRFGGVKLECCIHTLSGGSDLSPPSELLIFAADANTRTPGAGVP